MKPDAAGVIRLNTSVSTPCWISPADARWKAVLEQSDHDFYHLPGYLEAVSPAESGEACAYHERLDGGALLIPLFKRKIPFDLCADATFFDTASPYGYGGPVVTRNLPEASLLQGIRNYMVFAAREGVVTTFLRLHPVFGSKLRASTGDDDRMRIVHHGPTVSVDLALDIDTLNAAMRENHRRDIRKLQALGFRTRVDCWDDYREFQNIYRQTMARVGANGSYSFGEDYFRRLKERTGTVLHLCSVVGPRGDIAAAGLFSRVNGIVQYHLGGSADSHLSLSPSKLMFRDMRDWARDAGARTFHLGGGLGARRDSLFMFKRGFGTDEHEYRTVRIIHDMERCREWQARWLKLHDLDRFPDPDFFPLYRSHVSV